MTLDYSTRNTLLQKAKNQKDSKAWNELIKFYERYIYVIIRSMGVNENDTDDVLQKVLVELWKYLPEYTYDPEKSKFRSWIATITRNQTISFFRQQKAYAKKLDAVQQDRENNYLTSITPPDIEKIIVEQWEEFLTNTAMENITKNFSAKALQAFDAYTQGYSVNEISKQLSIPADSIYKYISRIKLRLIEEIQELKRQLDF